MLQYFVLFNPLVLWCCGILGFIVREDYKAASRLVRNIGVVLIVIGCCLYFYWTFSVHFFFFPTRAFIGCVFSGGLYIFFISWVFFMPIWLSCCVCRLRLDTPFVRVPHFSWQLVSMGSFYNKLSGDVHYWVHFCHSKKLGIVFTNLLNWIFWATSNILFNLIL